jgi:N-acyl-D-aspartate/D-glutamate deacylase
LRKPEVRRAIVDEIENGRDARWENLIKGADFENIIISVSPHHEEYIGKSIAQIAKMEAKDAFPRILGRYVRKQGVISLEEAIRKMTSLPGQTPAGIRWVIVNGELAVENNEVVGATSGQVLRRG